MKKYITIVLISVFILYYLFFYNKSYIKITTNFSKLQSPFIYILNENEFINFINNDEDGFLNNLSIYDLKSRNCKSTQEYKDKIISCFIDLNNDLKLKLIKCCKKADELLLNNYKDLINIPWKFCIYYKNLYENGYPHTRKDLIFISKDIIKQLSEKDLVKTLIHEKFHIFQRYNPDSYIIKNYLKKYNYEKYIPFYKFRENNPLLRSNPDLDNWIYKDDNQIYYCEYINENPKNIGETKQSSKLEHPFEHMAYEISEELIQYY